MKYYVTYRIDARYIAEVDADSLEDAMMKSADEWCSADFGVAEDIDGEVVVVEDENGNYIFER